MLPLTAGRRERAYWRMQLLIRPPAAAGRWLTLALDALLPPRCLACAAAVDVPGRLCAGCWSAVDFIAPPQCALCGFPFDYDEGADVLCGACIASPPAFDRARSVLRYSGVARDLVLGFKHRDRTHAAPPFAQWMERAGEALLADADAVAPVPLHRFRLFTRRYNQAALLARELARLCDLPFAPDLLARTRHTRSQAGLSRRGRIENVRGAFAVRRVEDVRGRRIVLVDDVMTTGATAGACAAVLKRAGALGVDVLSLARVVPGHDRDHAILSSENEPPPARRGS